MMPRERAFAIADTCRVGPGLWHGDVIGEIEQAIIAAVEEEREAAAQKIGEHADKIWEIGKRIEAAGRNGDFALWHEVSGFRTVCDWLFEVIDEQRREIERLEREVAPLIKPQPPSVKAGCMDV